MKRLLSLILTFFFALNNNVAFQASDAKPFAPESYYRVEGNEEPDYRYMYENYTNLQTSGKCISTSTNLSNNATLVVLDDAINLKYWFVSGKTDIDENFLDNIGEEYTFEKNAYIVAPQACIVQTKTSDGGGHSMLLATSDGKYKIYVQGMERWFCDRRRSTPDGIDPMDYTWVHTANVEGYTIPKGYMIGVADEGTTVTIVTADGAAATMTEFYKH